LTLPKIAYQIFAPESMSGAAQFVEITEQQKKSVLNLDHFKPDNLKHD